MSVTNKKSIVLLYSGSDDLYSHRTRIVLAEKDITFNVIEVDLQEYSQEVADLNPYGSVPILVDRDLVLYESRIIMEYLDERFPFPPLLPVYPVKRSKCRLMIFRVERDWYSLVNVIENGSKEQRAAARKELTENLIGIAPIFADMPYFLSNEFTLVDCSIAPILWRLPQLGIELPKSAAAVEDYAKRLFERPTFESSLTETEHEIRLDFDEEEEEEREEEKEVDG
ncbi:MAG: stringent starvation protein A [Gammaproteobacteria bacterium]|nr:stringent starvation protein A [Gammaproteobacteria bacterium]